MVPFFALRSHGTTSMKGMSAAAVISEIDNGTEKRNIPLTKRSGTRLCTPVALKNFSDARRLQTQVLYGPGK